MDSKIGAVCSPRGSMGCSATVDHVVGEADGCRAGEQEGLNLRVVVIHDRSSGPARSFLCPQRSSRRWCQGSRHDSSWPTAASGAARQGTESVDAPGARDSGSFGPSHRLDGYTQENNASTRVVGRKGSVSGKRKGEGASGASFSPLRRNIEQVTGTVVTGCMCNSWVAPLLLAAVQQSILGATSSTRQAAAAATLGEDKDAVSTVFPPSAARYGGSMAVSTSWAQHGATMGRSAGDVGTEASPARRLTRGARPQLLGGDLGSRCPRASSLPPALPLPSPTSSLPRFLVEVMDLDWGAVPQGGGGGTGRAGRLEGI
jgi:hypothetical protein